MSQVSAKRNWFHIGLLTDEFCRANEASSRRLDLLQFVCSVFGVPAPRRWAEALYCPAALRTSPASVQARVGCAQLQDVSVFPITWMCCSWFDHLQNRAVTSWKPRATPVNANSWKGSLFHARHIIWAEVQGQRKRGERSGLWLIMQSPPCWEARGPSWDTQQCPPAQRTRYPLVCYPEQEAQSKLRDSLTITVVKSDAFRERGKRPFLHTRPKGNKECFL